MIFAITLALCIVTSALLWQIYRCILCRNWTKRIPLLSLTAYVEKDSYFVGDTIAVCVHSKEKVTATVMRLGKELEQTEISQEIDAFSQSNSFDFWQGFHWEPNLKIKTGTLNSGAYIIHLEQVGDAETCYRVPLILKPTSHVDVAVIASTNTWEAYNPFGGISNYVDRVSPWPLSWLQKLLKLLNLQASCGDRHRFPSVPLATHRPNDAIDEDMRNLDACPIDDFSHLLRAEWSLLRHLENRGVSYGLFSDRDLAFEPLLTSSKLLIFNTHSEYWSQEMIGRLQAFLEAGGHALFVSGNNAYRMINFLERGLVVTNFKTGAELTSPLLGASYDAEGYLSHGGYRVAAPDHWLFEETEAFAGQLFGCNTLVPEQGASGYETDKVTQFSGDVTVLAIGANDEGPAFITYKRVGRGSVLNTGSVASAPWVEKDTLLAGLVNRYIDNATATPSESVKTTAA